MKNKRENPIAEPTNAELDILRVLWQYGPSTVRFVHDKLSESKDVIYTSTLKQMQVMAEKGSLGRDESQMKHVYSAVQKETAVTNHFLKKFVDSFYEGSPAKLVMHLLGDKKSSKKDIEQIREMLDKLDRK